MLAEWVEGSEEWKAACEHPLSPPPPLSLPQARENPAKYLIHKTETSYNSSLIDKGKKRNGMRVSPERSRGGENSNRAKKKKSENTNTCAI